MFFNLWKDRDKISQSIFCVNIRRQLVKFQSVSVFYNFNFNHKKVVEYAQPDQISICTITVTGEEASKQDNSTMIKV